MLLNECRCRTTLWNENKRHFLATVGQTHHSQRRLLPNQTIRRCADDCGPVAAWRTDSPLPWHALLTTYCWLDGRTTAEPGQRLFTTAHRRSNQRRRWRPSYIQGWRHHQWPMYFISNVTNQYQPCHHRVPENIIAPSLTEGADLKWLLGWCRLSMSWKESGHELELCIVTQYGHTHWCCCRVWFGIFCCCRWDTGHARGRYIWQSGAC